MNNGLIDAVNNGLIDAVNNGLIDAVNNGLIVSNKLTIFGASLVLSRKTHALSQSAVGIGSCSVAL